MCLVSLKSQRQEKRERGYTSRRGRDEKGKKERREGEGEEGTTAGLSNSVAQCLKRWVCVCVFAGVCGSVLPQMRIDTRLKSCQSVAHTQLDKAAILTFELSGNVSDCIA